MLALYIAAGIVLLVLLVLSVPVDMAFDVYGHGAARSRMRMGWLFGLLGKELGRGTNKPKEQGSKREKKSPKEQTPIRKKKTRSAKPLLSLLMTKGVSTGLLTLSRRILSSVRVRHLDARLVVGLDDPADTGMLYSALWPVLAPLTDNSSANVRMEFSFGEPALDLTARGRIRIFPIQMVWWVLLFALSPAGLQVMKLKVMRR